MTGKPTYAELAHRVAELGKVNAESKRREEEFQEREERYRLIAEGISDIVWTANMDLRYTYVSPSVERFIGYTPSELIGKSIVEHLTASAAETVAQRFIEAFTLTQAGRVTLTKMELERTDKHGSPAYGEVTFTFRCDAEGKPQEIVGVTRDITERKREEKRGEQRTRLKETLLRFATLEKKLKLITDAVVEIFEADFSRIWLAKPADLCDSGCIHAIIREGPHVCRRRDRCLHLMSSSGRYTHVDGEWHRRVPLGAYQIGRIAAEEKPRFVTNDVARDPCVHDRDWAGRLGLVSFAGYRLLDSDGSPLGVLALFSKHPISLQENSLLEDLANTAAQVIQGKREEEKRRVIEAKMQEAQRLESLGLMAGGLAHDLNNLLTPILGNLSIVRTYGELDDEIADLLTDAEKASLRAKSLLQQLLTFARGGEPIRKTIHVARLIRETAKFALSGSSVSCEFSLPEDLWLVDTDEAQLSQVIQNVVINAEQAMAGGGVIHVLGENLILGHAPDSGVEEGSYVRICVVDSGCGIPEKHLSKIFDPFFTTKEKGRGLGLATAYSILRRHGGHIRVSSKVGVGSRVEIYLPASRKTSVSEGPTKLELAMGKGRVLLIDDDEFVRRSAQEILKRMGCEVESAGDGEEGIRLYERARESGRAFCAVIMDLTIHGGMGGKGAAQKLLELDPQARVIVSSGYSNDPVMSQFRDYGFSGVLAKPYRIEELAEAIQLALAGKEE